MARKIVAGNWKMNQNFQEGIDLITRITDYCESADLHNVEVVIAPPSIHLAEGAKVSRGKKLSIAAQNCSEHEAGAYTGEISVDMITSCGVEVVIIGHSERRQYYGETDELVNLKLKKVHNAGILPIVCVGESLEARKSNTHEDVVRKQLDGALAGFTDDDLDNLVIAYEPVWAIGTGETATPDQAQDMHHFIRKYLTKKFNAMASDEVSILYGGSVKPDNAKELFAQPDVDGGLIGGASLKYDDFVSIIESGSSVLR